MVRLRLEYANSVWLPYKIGDIEVIEKVQKRPAKLNITLKHLPVFEIVHDICHLEVAVKLNFNTFSTTRGNKYKLQKSSSSST